MEKVPLVIINSPTATGKTELAVNLALEFGGEIISADSLQVYRYLDIGTAKPSQEQRKIVNHHMIDIVDPDEEFTAAIYTRQARLVIDNLNHWQTELKEFSNIIDKKNFTRFQPFVSINPNNMHCSVSL